MGAEFLIKLLFRSDAEQAVKGATAQVDGLAKKVSGFAMSFQSLGGFATGLLGGLGLTSAADALRGFEERLEKVRERAKQLKDINLGYGLDKNLIQRLINVTDVDTATKAIELMASAQEKLKRGQDTDHSIAKSFAAFGVSPDVAKMKDFQSLFLEITRSIERMPMNGEKIAAVRDLFGRGGMGIVAGLRKGLDSATGSRDLIGDSDLAKLDELNYKLKSVGATWTQFWTQVSISWANFRLNLFNTDRVLTSIAQFTSGNYAGAFSTLTADQPAPDAAKLRHSRQAEEKRAAATALKAEEAKQAQRNDEANDLRIKNDKESASIAYDKLSAQEKLLKLKADEARIQQILNEEKDPLFREKLRKDLLDTQKKEVQLERKEDKQTTNDIQPDKLAQIGLFRGGSDAGNVQQMQLSKLEEMKSEIAGLRRDLTTA